MLAVGAYYALLLLILYLLHLVHVPLLYSSCCWKCVFAIPTQPTSWREVTLAPITTPLVTWRWVEFDKFEYRSRCDIGARRLSWSLFVKFFIDPVTIFFNIKCKVETILLWRYNNLVSMSENFRRKLLILRPIKNFSRWCQFYKTLHFNFSVLSFMLLSRFLLLSNRLKMYT